MSRMGSGKGKKVKPKSPKEQIKDLTEQNTELTEQLIALQNQHQDLSNKLTCTVSKLLEGIKRSDFSIKPSVSPLDIPTDTLLTIVGKMIVKKRISDMSVEARVEELETRVTKMSMDIARMTKKTMAYENGLEDVLIAGTVEAMRDRVYHLQLIAGQEYHTFTAEEAFSQRRSHSSASDVTTETLPSRINGHVTNHVTGVNGAGSRSVASRPQSSVDRLRDEATKLNLTPPPRRLPGDTHIKMMHGDLRLLIMKEVSLQKASGADWRMLAERVGIPEDSIQYWRSLRLECPMGRVMAEWAKSCSATVRMLHRHLASPQMRCTLLAKRISDFYEVD